MILPDYWTEGERRQLPTLMQLQGGRWRTLFDAVRGAGWKPFICPDFDAVDGGLGEFQVGGAARACGGKRLALLSDCWDHTYSASHEIAEYEYGFEHSVDMFAMQAQIIALWCKGLTR